MGLQISIVICRVGAVLLWVLALTQLGYAIPGMLYGPSTPGWGELVFIAIAAAPVVVGIVLWVFAEQIASAIVAGDQTSDAAPSLSDVDILRIGTALIGVYLVAGGIVAAVSTEVSAMAMSDMGAEFEPFKDENAARNMGRRAANLAEIVIGVALFFGRERLANIYSKAKRAGVDTG